MFNFAVHRKILQLKSGTRVLLRPMTSEDTGKLAGLFKSIPDSEALFLKDDIRNKKVIKGWTDNIDFNKVMPLMACVEDRIVGDCSLHLGTGSGRHMGEIRILLAEDFRGQGLGSAMILEMEEVARRLGLIFLKGEVLLDQIGLVKAFRRLGFDLRCTLDDYFIAPDDSTHDVTILLKRLVKVEYRF
ncbi:GNAT family N-acetyltransferase [bacterium]|nr:MAG: GNAT family N-acetyltransferase [bacterium]